MKTLFAAAMAVSLLTGSLAVQADGRDDRDRGRHYDRDHDRDHGRKDFRGHDRRDDRDRGRNDRRDDRRHDRYDDRHDGRHHNNWDRRDAYRSGYVQGRFDRGRYIAPRGYHVRHWRHGDRLPSAYYSSRYVVSDYHRYHLHSPPRGYHWVRVNNDVLLAAITSGVVVSVVNGLFY